MLLFLQFYSFDILGAGTLRAVEREKIGESKSIEKLEGFDMLFQSNNKVSLRWDKRKWEKSVK